MNLVHHNNNLLTENFKVMSKKEHSRSNNIVHKSLKKKVNKCLKNTLKGNAYCFQIQKEATKEQYVHENKTQGCGVSYYVTGNINETNRTNEYLFTCQFNFDNHIKNETSAHTFLSLTNKELNSFQFQQLKNINTYFQDCKCFKNDSISIAKSSMHEKEKDCNCYCGIVHYEICQLKKKKKPNKRNIEYDKSIKSQTMDTIITCTNRSFVIPFNKTQMNNANTSNKKIIFLPKKLIENFTIAIDYQKSMNPNRTIQADLEYEKSVRSFILFITSFPLTIILMIIFSFIYRKLYKKDTSSHNSILDIENIPTHGKMKKNKRRKKRKNKEESPVIFTKGPEDETVLIHQEYSNLNDM